MGFPISSIGSDSGLIWEQNLNQALLTIDQHNHTPGSGVQIPPSGLNINAPLPFNNQLATGVQAVVFNAQTGISATVPAVGAAYLSGVDLYFNDGTGTNPPIQITSGGAVNATSSGISSGTATASFVGSILVVNQAANTPASIQSGSLLIGNNTASSNFCTLEVPTALASNYNFILPPGYPAAASFLQMDTSGNVTAAAAVAAGLTSANLSASANILGSQLSASAAIVGTQLSATAGIVGTQLTAGTLTTTQVAANTLLTSNNAGNPVSVSSSSGAFSGSGSETQVTNFSLSYTLSNTSKYVVIQVVGDGTNNTSFVRGTGGVVFILANNVEIARFNVGTPSGATINIPPSSVGHVYSPASSSAITYTIKTVSVDFFFTKMTVREA